MPAGAVPAAVRSGVERALERRGHGPVVEVEPVAGGCINHGARLGDGAGRSWFLKWNDRAPPEMFAAESDGLEALAAADALAVPGVVDLGSDEGVGWLLLEHLAPGPPAPDHDEALGRGLALLHRSGGDGPHHFGWSRDNWIGSLPQHNEPLGSWAAFWRDRRIVPQLERARRLGHLTEADELDRLVERIPDALASVDDAPASLLHGDLWSGNAYAGASGAPVLVDPAVYRGHGEVDLAMMELFGGFGTRVFDAYDEVTPIPPEYPAMRRPLYQLYYLLVHVNLFGAGYVRRTRAAAHVALEAVG